MKLFIASTALALLSAPFAIRAGPMATCGDQEACVDFSITKSDTGSICAGCDFKICMKVSFKDESHPNCPKDSGTVSHTCVRKSTDCLDGNTCNFLGDASVETGSIPEGYEQCQTVPAGGTAYFLLKDGSGCGGSGTRLVTDLDDTITDDLEAECMPSTAAAVVICRKENTGVDSCTGNAAGKECIWEVTAPPASACGACVASEGTCCPVIEGCEGACSDAGYPDICLPPPAEKWDCKMVCEKVIEEPFTCEEIPTEVARRALEEKAKTTHSNWLRA